MKKLHRQPLPLLNHRTNTNVRRQRPRKQLLVRRRKRRMRYFTIIILVKPNAPSRSFIVRVSPVDADHVGAGGELDALVVALILWTFAFGGAAAVESGKGGDGAHAAIFEGSLLDDRGREQAGGVVLAGRQGEGAGA